MKLTDSHCHLNHETLHPLLDQLIAEAKAASVLQMFVVGWDKESSIKAIEIAKQYQEVKAIIGLHPVESTESSNVEWIHLLASNHRDIVVGIGECGLDFHWKKEKAEHDLQKKHLIEQIKIANALALPIVIHCRDAYDEILPILKANPLTHHGVMHCYGGPQELVEEFIKLGFYLSYGGPITFKNANEARASLQVTPLDKLLIETDAPYLSPHPHRGKVNSPLFLPIIFNQIATTLSISPEILANRLDENVNKLFHVKIK